MEQILISDPGLSCANCFKFYREGALPMCMDARGCPVEDYASDANLNDAVERYICGKMASHQTGDMLYQRRVARELELDKELSVLIQAETIWTRFVSQKRKKR